MVVPKPHIPTKSATHEARKLHDGAMDTALSLHNHTAAFHVHATTEQILGLVATAQVPPILSIISLDSPTFAVNGPCRAASSPPTLHIIPAGVWIRQLGAAVSALAWHSKRREKRATGWKTCLAAVLGVACRAFRDRREILPCEVRLVACVCRVTSGMPRAVSG